MKTIMSALLAIVPLLGLAEEKKENLPKFSLAADSEPQDKQWESPATLSYTRNGDKSSTGTIDAYLKWTFSGREIAEDGTAKQATWSIGPYIHRDKDSNTPRDDKGIVLTASQAIITGFPGGGWPHDLHWNAKISVGKTLQGVDDDAGNTQYFDKTKDRETAFLSGYFQPGKTGPVDHTPEQKDVPSSGMELYFNWKAGLYSDNSSGGNGKGTGRLSGTLAALSLNFFPLGTEKKKKRIGIYGVAPVIALSAQGQHDTSSSAGRKKDTYKLYTAALTLEFNTAADSHFTPSLNLSRSVGADLLTGRAYEGKTEVSFGLAFK